MRYGMNANTKTWGFSGTQINPNTKLNIGSEGAFARDWAVVKDDAEKVKDVAINYGKRYDITEHPIFASLAAVSTAASAYHGYKRNGGKLGWTAGWALLGGLFPVITPAVALYQGFGKRKK